MTTDPSGPGSPEPGGPAASDANGDAIDRVWGSAGPTGLLAAACVAAAITFGGVVFAATAYAPAETEPATVLRQYFSSTGGGRSVCGIEVQVASGEKGRAGGGNVCSVYDEGDQAVALVSSITGDVVGVRHAGQDLGRSGNPLAGLVPMFALGTLTSAFLAAGRRAEPGLAKMAVVTLVGGVLGLAGGWFLF